MTLVSHAYMCHAVFLMLHMQISTCCWELMKVCSPYTLFPTTQTQSWNRCVDMIKGQGCSHGTGVYHIQYSKRSCKNGCNKVVKVSAQLLQTEYKAARL